MQELKGVYVPICTPYTDGKVDIYKLESNMEKFYQTNLQGYFALGSNGENCLLTEDEKKKVLSTILKRRSRNQLVMAGCSHESTRGTIELAKWVASIGAEIGSVLSPHYFKKSMSDEAIVKFFEDVADNSPIPIVIYNAPGFAGGLAISVNAMTKLSKHPNILGMKDSTTNGPSAFLIYVDKKFAVMAGSADIFLTTLVMGGVAGVLSIANFHPDACCKLYDLYIQGKMEEARYFQYAISRLNKSVSGKNGVAGVKTGMDLVGLHGGDPRLPLLPLNIEEKRNIFNALSRFEEEYPEFKADLIKP